MKNLTLTRETWHLFSIDCPADCREVDAKHLSNGLKCVVSRQFKGSPTFVSQPELALPRQHRHRQLTLQPWPPAWPGFAAFTGLAFNLCVKPGIAQRLVLV